MRSMVNSRHSRSWGDPQGIAALVIPEALEDE